MITLAVSARPWTVLSVCVQTAAIWQLLCLAARFMANQTHAHMHQPLCQQTSYSSTRTALRSDFICTKIIIQNPLQPPRKSHCHLCLLWLSLLRLSLIYGPGPVLSVVKSLFAIHYSIISTHDPHMYCHCNLSSDHCEQSIPSLRYAA